MVLVVIEVDEEGVMMCWMWIHPSIDSEWISYDVRMTSWIVFFNFLA